MKRIVLVLATGLLLLPVALSGQCCIIVPNGENPMVVDEAPVPTNGDEAVELLRRIAESAPSAWLGESVEAWVHVDTLGAVVETRVARSSGIPDLDAVLLAVAQRMKFSPARTDGAAVDVWLRFPVSLRTAQSRRESTS
jgi:TonB family protein